MELIDLRCRRTEGRRSCCALHGSASALAHGERIDGDPALSREFVNYCVSHNPRGTDSAPLPQCRTDLGDNFGVALIVGRLRLCLALGRTVRTKSWLVRCGGGVCAPREDAADLEPIAVPI